MSISFASRALATILATALALAACQAPAPGAVAPSSSPIATEAPPTATPPPDITESFRKRFAAITSAEIRITGRLSAGNQTTEYEGRRVFDGPDAVTTMSTTAAGGTTVEQRAIVGGRRYLRLEGQAWLIDAAPLAGDHWAAILKASASASEVGVDTSSPNHRLESGVQSFAPVSFGYGELGTTGTSGTARYAFTARPDGTLVSVELRATWQQVDAGLTVDAALTLTFEVTRIGGQQTIPTPDPLGNMFRSDRLGYSIAYPAKFTFDRRGEVDVFSGPLDTSAYVSRQRLPAGVGLDEVAAQELAALERALSKASGTTDRATVGGIEARELHLTGNPGGLSYAVTEFVFLRGRYVYIVGILGPAANDEANRGTLAAMLATLRLS